jgi:hypothetical protein
LKETFDYIFLCGVFNLKVNGIDETIKNVLKMLFEHCGTALAFSALSADCRKKDFELHYVDIQEIVKFAKTELSPNAVIRQGRVPDDFTLFIYKSD